MANLTQTAAEGYALLLDGPGGNPLTDELPGPVYRYSVFNMSIVFALIAATALL